MTTKQLPNEYESKTIDAVTRTLKYIEDASDNVKNTEDEIKALSNAITHLYPVLDSLANDAVAYSAIKTAIDIKTKYLEGLHKTLETSHKRLQEYKSNLSFLKSYVCPHINTVYDHTDYHKNEEFNKCVLCGSII